MIWIENHHQQTQIAIHNKVLEEGSEVFEIDLAELGLNEGDMDEMYEEDEVVDMEMDAASDDVEEGDVEIPEDLAKQLLDILQGELEADDDEEVEVALDVEDDESEEADEDEEDAEDMDDDDEVVEIDETMLKRELARMRGTLDEGDMDAHFGGGSEDKEVFVDGKDDDLNVHAGDLGTVSEARLRTALKNESRQNRALRKQVSGYKQVTAKLQEQLEQMNLFNAKLLYVNKLMQNESISRKQLKAIVESVDKAETLREVRLVYKTLTESAGKRRKSRPMNESRRPGSASRASRSGGANNSTEHANRWATLAGIKE